MPGQANLSVASQQPAAILNDELADSPRNEDDEDESEYESESDSAEEGED